MCNLNISIFCILYFYLFVLLVLCRKLRHDAHSHKPHFRQQWIVMLLSASTATAAAAATVAEQDKHFLEGGVEVFT
jgi:hypothetical protein